MSALVFLSFLHSSALYLFARAQSLSALIYVRERSVSPEFAGPWLEEVSCGTELDADSALCLLRSGQDFATTHFLRVQLRIVQVPLFLPPSHLENPITLSRTDWLLLSSYSSTPCTGRGEKKDCLETNKWRVLPKWFNTDCIKCQLLKVPYPVIRKRGDGLPVQGHIAKYA